MRRAFFSLLVTDSAACLATPGGELIEGYDDWRDIAAALAADRHRPVRLVLDSAEQAYEQVSLTLRNPFDRRRLLARKLHALAPLPTTAGILRLEKQHYLLAAGAAQGALADALALLAQTGNRLHDITLLPLEAGAYLAGQFPALADGWGVVTLDSAIGGFHQLVLRQGRTVFGRLMPAPRSGTAWQREIGTMLAYLPRLGLPRETPVALVANLEQVPLGTADFPGATVGELFFLPADNRDFASGFLHWHSRQSRGQLPVGHQHWWFDRASRMALRTACCLTAIIALLGTVTVVHLHRQAVTMTAETRVLAGQQAQLAATLAKEAGADGAATQLRLALALHEAIAKPAGELPKVMAALTNLPPELGLRTLLYQRTPFTLRADYSADPAAQIPALAAQLPGLTVSPAADALLVTGP